MNKLTKPNHLIKNNHNTLVVISTIAVSVIIGAWFGATIMFAAMKADYKTAKMKFISYEYNYGYLLEEEPTVKKKHIQNE